MEWLLNSYSNSWGPRGTQAGQSRALWESLVPLKEPDKAKVILTRMFVLCKFVTTTSTPLILSCLTPCVCKNLPACPKVMWSWVWWMQSLWFQCVWCRLTLVLSVCVEGGRAWSRPTGLGRGRFLYERLWLHLPVFLLSAGILIVQ